MNYTCPLCRIDPSNHSLTKIKETEKYIYYYSCPSQAKLYFDTNGIINHYNGMLSEIPKNKKWIWIFDSKDFDLKHFIQINLGIQLAKLISSKFSHNLLKIIIINPTIYILSTYNILKPFLTKEVNNIIIFDSLRGKNIDDLFEY
jgi:hypothetical protein